LQVLRLTLVGAAAGFVAYLVSMPVDLTGQAAQAIHLTLLAAALGLAASPPTRKKAVGTALLSLGVGLICTLCMQALAAFPPKYPWFGMGVYGLAVGIIAGRDLKDFRRFLLPLATGVSVALATFVEQTFRTKVGFVGYVPAFVAAPAYGAVFGFLTSVGLVVRHLWVERDPVAQAFQKLRPSLEGEMRDLCQRAVDHYGRVQQVLHDRQQQGNSTEPDLVQAVENLVLRIFAQARKWHEVELEAGRTSAEDLSNRIEEIDAKIQKTGDSVARKQYGLARQALNTQLGYLRDISRNRERVMAQVYNYLTALERLHLAILNHRGADAAKLSDEIQPILDEIDDVGSEMDFESDAFAEVAEAAIAGKEMAKTAQPFTAETGTEVEPEELPEAEEAEPKALDQAQEAAGEEPDAGAEAEAEEPSSGDPELHLQAKVYK